MSLFLVLYPCVDIGLLVLFASSHNTILDTCGGLQLEEREARLELTQLRFYLGFGNAFLGNLF